MIGLNLYWKRDGEDIDVGMGWCDLLPPVGSRLVFVSEHGTVWRVTEHYFHLTMEGSPRHIAWRSGRTHDEARVTVFVVPTEGPFEA